jgi:hypothetical protein
MWLHCSLPECLSAETAQTSQCEYTESNVIQDSIHHSGSNITFYGDNQRSLPLQSSHGPTDQDLTKVNNQEPANAKMLLVSNHDVTI